MRITRVTASAFGPLSDRELRLAPGLNIVHGPNESAKSSWHAAATVALCGLKGGARNKEVGDFEHQHRPWDDDERWAVATELQLDDGRQIEITRDLHRKRSTVVDLGLGGREVNDDLERDRSPDGAVWLGLTRSSFAATASIRQADILRVTAEAGGLTEFLGRAAATGGEETASGAIRRIEAFRKGHVGADKRNAVKPLRRARERVEVANDRLLEARARHGEYLAAGAEARTYQQHLDTLELQLAWAEAALRQREADEARAHLDDLRALAARFVDGEPNAPRQSDLAPLIQARAELAALPRRPEAPELTTAELDGQLAQLPDMPEGPTSIDPTIVDLVTRWRVADDNVEAHRNDEPGAPRTGPTTAAVERAIAEAGDLEPLATDDLAAEATRLRTTASAEQQAIAAGEATAARKRRLGFGLVVAAIACVIAGAFAHPAAFAGSALALLGIVLLATTRIRPADHTTTAQLAANLADVEADLAHRQTVNATRAEAARLLAEQLTAAGLPAEPQYALVAASEIEAHNHRHQRWVNVLGELLAERDRAASAAHHALDPITDRPDVEVATLDQASLDPGQRYEQALAMCVERGRVARAASERPALQQARTRAAEIELRISQHDAALEELTARVIAAAATLDIDGDVAEIDHAIARRSQHDDQAMAMFTRERAAWERLQSALDGREFADIEASVLAGELEAETALANVRSAAAERNIDPSSRRGHHELVSAVSSAREAVARAQTRHEQLAATCPDVATVEAEMEEAEQELDRVLALAATLDATTDFLLQAQDKAHRSIAPAIGAELSKWIGVITDGRYTDAGVDPETLHVRVRDAAGQWRDADQLSHGTTEQLYLVLRVVLSKLLTAGHDTCPLFIDDATVHADDTRTERILAFLREVAREQQVVLFTQEASVVAWGSEHLDPDVDRLISLGEDDVLGAGTIETESVENSEATPGSSGDGVLPLPGFVA